MLYCQSHKQLNVRGLRTLHPMACWLKHSQGDRRCEPRSPLLSPRWMLQLLSCTEWCLLALCSLPFLPPFPLFTPSLSSTLKSPPKQHLESDLWTDPFLRDLNPRAWQGLVHFFFSSIAQWLVDSSSWRTIVSSSHGWLTFPICYIGNSGSNFGLHLLCSSKARCIGAERGDS